MSELSKTLTKNIQLLQENPRKFKKKKEIIVKIIARRIGLQVERSGIISGKCKCQFSEFVVSRMLSVITIATNISSVG